MSDHSGRSSSRNRRRGSRQKQKQGNQQRPTGDVHLKGSSSLERLRDSVEIASQELKRLREENAALAERIAQLESRPVDLEGETIVSFDENPELIRRKVGGFIEAIDRYLQKEENRGQQ